MEPIEGSETSAFKSQDAGEIPKRKHTKQKYGLRPYIYRSLFFQWTTPADSRGSEWDRPWFEPVKEASWTFRLQVKELESSVPGH